ncbi:MAG TPA: TlpA disulfide reductase family protein [Flavobacteriaceae bacterium]|nr:TlpA disulfide reductase family protein [Flavobacteriaceae bacterium]
MKQLTLFIFIVALVSCSGPRADYTIIEGNILHYSGEKVQITGGDFNKEISIEENGNFIDTLFLKYDGLYDLYSGREMVGLFLEKGKRLTISFDETRIVESLTFGGDLAEINNLLVEKSKWLDRHTDYKSLFESNEQDFLAALEDNKKGLDSLYGAHKVSKNHREILEKEDRFFKAILVENYENSHRNYTRNPEFKVSPTFYNNLSDINFKDTLEYRRNLVYRDLVETHMIRLTTENTSMSDDNFLLTYLKKIDQEFPNGYAKDQLMYNYLQYGLSPDEQLHEVYAIYKNINPGKENLEKIEQLYEVLEKVLPGNTSPSFTFENYQGGTTSLEDLRGKYVYIDVWATWCGPCIQEIPYLQQFEKDYEGKNIQVVSISIDEEKNYEKWRSMVESRSLGGIQLMADNNWKSDFVTQYGIMGIPRFILIDPEGKIVAADAYRPSDPRLRAQVDQLL